MAIGVQVTFDAHDPGRFAVFWAEARVHRATTTARLCDLARLRPAHRAAGGTVERLRRPRRPGRGRATAVFQRVPEGKSAKNRVHLDLNIGATVSDPEQRRSVVRQRSEQLADAGGSVLREVDEPTGWCVVMADPEGNEFCLLSGAVHEL